MPINAKDETSSPDDTITLKPIFSLRPGVYLTIIYSLILAIAFFGVFFLPGILFPGSIVRFTSEPWGCAVELDGGYLGTTPFESFIAAGERRFSFHSPGFEIAPMNVMIGSRIFASWLAPHRQAVASRLVSSDPLSAFASAAEEYTDWAAVGESSVAYPMPRELSDAAYRLGPYTAGTKLSQDFSSLIQTLVRQTASNTALTDLCRAYYMIGNGGQTLSPLRYVESLRSAAVYASRASGSAVWLKSIIPDELANTIAASSWYANQTATARSAAEEYRSSMKVTSAAPRRIAGQEFLNLPGGIVAPASYPRRITIRSFWIAVEEADVSRWTEFLRAEPAWNSDKSSELIASGKATIGYMTISDDPKYPAPAQAGLSWHAAKAYCDWLTSKLPAEFSGYVVRLPTEAEWEYAAGADQSRLKNMNGGLWEWCADTFVPIDFMPPTLPDFGGDKSVRGGSWANTDVDIGTRASLLAETCSPFVGFRPVIARPLDYARE